MFSGAVHLSIQKLLPESTGSAGLLIRHNRPIVFFKKVALNFPPLEQGPAGKWTVGTCFSPKAALLDFDERPSKTLSVFESLASEDQNFSARQIVKLNSFEDLYVDQ